MKAWIFGIMPAISPDILAQCCNLVAIILLSFYRLKE